MDEPPPKERLALADQLRGAAVGSLGDGVSQMQERLLGRAILFKIDHGHAPVGGHHGGRIQRDGTQEGDAVMLGKLFTAADWGFALAKLFV